MGNYEEFDLKGGPETEPLSLDPVSRKALATLLKFQVESTDWGRQLRVLAGSLLVFVIVGWLVSLVMKEFTFFTLQLMIVVLFIHEAGHYLGMRFLGYRNLYMFFIPLLGAAVSGYGCVSVVKQSIVYLLGPIPGILLGYFCGMVFGITHDYQWMEAGRMFILVNALNLLPIYPLDGGQFLFGLLPPRRDRFQWVIQIFIIGMILCLGVNLDNWAGVGVGLGLLLQTWSLYKFNRVTVRLLKRGIVESAGECREIPAPVAADLIQAIHEEIHPIGPEELAKIAWQVWIRLRAPRPGFWEVGALLGGYLLTLVAVWGFWTLYIAGQF